MSRERIKRAPTTVHLDPRIARAIRVKAALTGKSLSDLVNDGLTRLLREDEKHIRLFKERAKEPSRRYEDVIADLRRDGLL